MGRMNEIVNEMYVMLQEHDEALNAYGHADPLVVTLKRDLLAFGLDFVETEVRCIDHDFDEMVFNNQTEGRF